ncbi:TetR/AcrR family transcriptional regulator [Mucilaginibacter ginsenosidivorans]|uniref:TetR/AcrR family transcriptional regulator n=1 Tax=Mucilaginibacter ginsenosidivorans TaxID=398053 RepID=A0A5B8UYG6_9SPHI|nr:TetR/AcrR family transcriptional regulator [Mucilaginibacter ginsenosidivorans]QEC63391.1 TetR/AcrR family transcriptional regulator [Mucilaginibacter ginsenosidivorans]
MGKAERTRKFITEKTAPLFNQKGYAGTSLTDMTDATGLTKGSIYGNFADKDEVALAAFDYNMSALIEQVRIRQASERTASGKLKAFMDVYRDGLQSPVLSNGCPIVNAGSEADDTHVKLNERVNDALGRWHKSISAIIQQGKMQGEFRESVNSTGFASLMIAMIEGGFTLSKISGDKSYLDQALDQLERLIETKLRR